MKHSRSSNGHRTVLHCSEISVRERRYIPGEPGVRAQPPPVTQSVAAHSPMQVHAESRYDGASADLFRHSNASRRDVYRLNVPSLDDEELEAEKAEANAALAHQQYYQQRDYRHAGHGRAHQAPPYAGSQRTSAPSGSGRVLRRGDTLFWSDLVAGGERAQPFDPDPILERPTVGR